MEGSGHRYSAGRRLGILKLAVCLAGLLAVACGNDLVINPVVPTGPLTPGGTGPFTLVFSLDATFQAPHGGQPIEIALVRTSDGSVVTRAVGRVSATAFPAFVFTTDAVIERGTRYAVHYWIDSNLGGGTPGQCDPPAIDHQWSVEFFFPTNDIRFTTSHNPALTEDVCRTFR